MNSNSSYSQADEFVPLPGAAEHSPEWRVALELNERAQLAQGRLALGCCLFWLSDGGYLLTALPPMGDVRGGDTWMTVYTAEHLITLRGENLHLLAWSMKQQRVDDLRVTTETGGQDTAAEWIITSITAQERDED